MMETPEERGGLGVVEKGCGEEGITVGYVGGLYAPNVLNG